MASPPTFCVPGFVRPPGESGRCVAARVTSPATDALEGGAGQADVRAGAMLALSTLPDVKVTRTSFDESPVVQITNTQFSDNYAETLDLDAQTGVLVHVNGGTVGRPDSVDVTYHVTRVTTPSLDPAH